MFWKREFWKKSDDKKRKKLQSLQSIYFILDGTAKTSANIGLIITSISF